MLPFRPLNASTGQRQEFYCSLRVCVSERACVCLRGEYIDCVCKPKRASDGFIIAITCLLGSLA